MFSKRFHLKGLTHASSKPVRIMEEELKIRSGSGAVVVDVRPGTLFAAGHFPGSLNVELANPMFAACISVFLTNQSQILLVVDQAEDVSKAQIELSRAGFDNILGFINDDDLSELHQLTQLSVSDLKSTLSRGGKPAIIDVRSRGEWKSNGIYRSRNIPLAQLAARFLELSFSIPAVVVCQNGYQSAVAASWLQAHGFDSIHHLLGGMDAYISAPSHENIGASSFCSSQPGPAAFLS
jgi:hydroxyacylglutathione hydrolase